MNDLNITKEDVIELAATKLADAYADNEQIEVRVNRAIESRIIQYFEHSLKARIDDFLNAEMERLLNQTVNPVDIWGDKTGTPTTIRAQLAERAQKFWEVKVDDDGRESRYGGEPRHTQLMKKITKEEFEKAVKENAEVIVGAFKQALKIDAAKLVTEHIDKLINVGNRR
jgi:hypothetical protein